MSVHDPGPPAAPLVRPLRAGEELSTACVLATALAADGFVDWVSGGARERAIRFLHLGVASMAARHGCTLVDDELRGALVLMRPGTLPLSPSANVRMLPGLVRAVGLRRLPGVIQGLAALDAYHPAEPHWSGLALGVEPAKQGSGVGRALMEAGLKLADADRSAVYLETGDDGPQALYARYGFAPLARAEIAGLPPIVTMWRPAR